MIDVGRAWEDRDRGGDGNLEGEGHRRAERDVGNTGSGNAGVKGSDGLCKGRVTDDLLC